MDTDDDIDFRVPQVCTDNGPCTPAARLRAALHRRLLCVGVWHRCSSSPGRRALHRRLLCVGVWHQRSSSQGDGPIAFFSRVMAPHHLKLAAYERELIGLVKAVRHWWPYLWPKEFIVRTYHFNLKYLLDQRLSTISQHNWVSKLFGYQFSIEFKPGKQNVAADALSRREEDGPAVFALSLPSFDRYDQLRSEATSLPAFVNKRAEIADGMAGLDWSIDDVILCKGRIFLPSSSSQYTFVLQHAHVMGHKGVQKTLL
jgi:hypothetical protein